MGDACSLGHIAWDLSYTGPWSAEHEKVVLQKARGELRLLGARGLDRIGSKRACMDTVSSTKGGI